MKNDESKQQREGDGERHDDRSPDADQEKNQHDQYQNHPAKQIVLHRVGGQIDELAAVVIRNNFDVGRQNLAVQFLGLRFHALEDVLGLLAAEHEDDALDR